MSETKTESLRVDVFYGLEQAPTNFTISCQDFIFHVHRDVVAQASPVWNKMLTAGFAESFAEEIELLGYDSTALKLSFDILYTLLSGNGNVYTLAESCSDNAPLRVLVDKYELSGVTAILNVVVQSRTQQNSYRALEQRLQMQSNQHQDEIRCIKKRHENELSYKLMRPGMVVDYQDMPPIGTRVILNSNKNSFTAVPDPPLRGKIIANDEDGGTEIGVKWDNGTETHHMWCGKKGTHQLKYL